MQFQGKLINQTLKNGKNLVSSQILAHLAKFEPPIPPPPPKKNLAPSITRYHGHAQYQKKLMIQSLENIVTKQTDKLTDRRKSDFMGHIPTNVEPPIENY